MAAVVKRPIFSSNDPANTFPWADSITFDPVTRAVTIVGFNGLKDAAKQAAVNGARVVQLTLGKLGEPHALVVKMDGTLAFMAFSDLPSVVYAHLAFYDPVTQTVEVLDFKPLP